MPYYGPGFGYKDRYLTDYEAEQIGLIKAEPDVAEVDTSSTQTSAPIKVAQSNLLVNKKTVPVDAIAQMMLEGLTGTELLEIAREDLMTGQNVKYSPIKNIAEIEEQYSPLNILKLQSVDKTYFSRFPLFLADYLPESGTGTGDNGAIKYVDADGNLVINVQDLPSDLRIEVELLVLDSVISDTIYE
jgi:hypothetical protein